MANIVARAVAVLLLACAASACSEPVTGAVLAPEVFRIDPALLEKYRHSAETLEALAEGCPSSPGQELDFLSHLVERMGRAKEHLRLANGNPRMVAWVQRVYYDEPILDAWGRGIAFDYRLDRRGASFKSDGADGVSDTADDLKVVLLGDASWDPVERRMSYRYTWTWHVPRGLEESLEAYRAAGDTIAPG
jgi:hypothetical protein